MDEISTPPKKRERRLSRRISFKTAAKLSIAFPRLIKPVKVDDEPTELKIEAKLESVNFHLMTSRLHLAEIRVEDLQASWIQSRDRQIATAKLINFEILGTWPMSSLHNVNKQLSLFKNVNKQLLFFPKCKETADMGHVPSSSTIDWRMR